MSLVDPLELAVFDVLAEAEADLELLAEFVADTEVESFADADSPRLVRADTLGVGEMVEEGINDRVTITEGEIVVVV